MDKLNFIKSSLLNDLNYWKKRKEENNNKSMQDYYDGAISALQALYEKIKNELENKESIYI